MLRSKKKGFGWRALETRYHDVHTGRGDVNLCLWTSLIYYVVSGLCEHVRRCGETHCFPKWHNGLVSEQASGVSYNKIGQRGEPSLSLKYLTYMFPSYCISSTPDGVPDTAREPAMRRAPVYMDGETLYRVFTNLEGASNQRMWTPVTYDERTLRRVSTDSLQRPTRSRCATISSGIYGNLDDNG